MKTYMIRLCPFCRGIPEVCRTNENACWIRCSERSSDGPTRKTAGAAVQAWNKADFYGMVEVKTHAHMRDIFKMSKAEWETAQVEKAQA